MSPVLEGAKKMNGDSMGGGAKTHRRRSAYSGRKKRKPEHALIHSNGGGGRGSPIPKMPNQPAGICKRLRGRKRKGQPCVKLFTCCFGFHNAVGSNKRRGGKEYSKAKKQDELL